MNLLRVAYFGGDTLFYESLKDRFKKLEPQVAANFVRYDLSDDSAPRKLFLSAYQNGTDILYVDFSRFPQKAMSFCKLVTRNNEMRLKALVTLHNATKGFESLLMGVLSGSRLNYYKSIEIDDLVYDPLVMLGERYDLKREYAQGRNLGTLHLKQILRIGYVSKEHMRIETNVLLPTDEVIELETHPLTDIMPGNRFLVEDFGESDLYYNQRYRYHLKYTYVDDDLYKSMEPSWVRFKKSKSAFAKKISSHSLSYALGDVESRAGKLEEVKKRVDEWVEENQHHVEPKRLKILAIDHSLKLFREMDEYDQSFPYTLNFQTRLMGNHYLLERLRPHFLIYCYDDEFNTQEEFVELMGAMRDIEDYTPVVLVVNDGELKLKAHYDRSFRSSMLRLDIIFYRKGIELSLLQSLAKKIDNKLAVSRTEQKVFLKTGDPRSVTFCSRSIEIIKMSESELHFKAHFKIAMWSIFVVEGPVTFLLTVVPISSDSPEYGAPHLYRGLINGFGESEKAALRQFVFRGLRKG